MEYFDNLNYNEIESPYIMDNFLRTNKTKDYTNEIFLIIDKFGFLPNLILLHINQEAFFKRETSINIIIEKLFNSSAEEINFNVKYFEAEYIEKFLTFLLNSGIKQDFDKVSQIITEVLIAYFNKTYNCNKPEKFYISVVNIFNLCTELKLFELLDFSDIARIWDVIVRNYGYSINLKLELTAIVSGCHYSTAGQDGYILAYKGVHADRTSTMCDWDTYNPGQIYETAVVDNDPYNENSFGLSAWSYSKARSYCSDLVIPVKIWTKDIKFLDIKTGKIRCSKFTVLEDKQIL